jgi:hypothetical protein
VYSVLYSEIAVSRKRFGKGHLYTFLLGMTDTMTSHNMDLSSWDTLYKDVASHDVLTVAGVSRNG